MTPRWRKVQRDHNLEAGAALRSARDGMGFPDWEVTVLFYAALSMVNGWFELRGLDVPARHTARRDMIKRHLPHLHKNYNELRSLSEDARYGHGHDMDDRHHKRARELYNSVSDAIPWPTAQ